MKMVALVVLCGLISFNGVCSEMKTEIWDTWHLATVKPLDYEGKTIKGDLQIYYEKKHLVLHSLETAQSKKYEICARFIPQDKSDPLIKLEFFAKQQQKLEDLRRFQRYCNSVPIFILKQSQNNSEQIAQIMAIENTNEPEELLNLSEILVTRYGDYITLTEVGKQPISLYKPETIRNIHQALLKGQPFSIELEPGVTKKVKNFEFDTLFGWDGWALHLMPVSLGMGTFKGNKPEIVQVNLKDEQESYYYYRINKWIAKGLMAAIIFVITYQLKNKIHDLGTFFRTN